MCGEYEFAVELVVRFSAFHRQSHGGCKAGKIDCMTGAALTMMEYNGTRKGRPPQGKSDRYDPPGRNPVRLQPGRVVRRAA